MQVSGPIIKTEGGVEIKQEPETTESVAETILRLVESGGLKKCICGLLFTDVTQFYLHKGVHVDGEPKKCSFCQTKFGSWYEFTTHFFDHKNK